MTARITELPDGPADESGLTPRQRAILAVIRETVETRGYPPSVREIGEGVGLTSPSSVAHQLGTLERMGYLRRDPNRPRALVVADSPEQVAEQQAAAAMIAPYGPLNIKAPALLDKGLASTNRELTKWYKEGITAEELEYRKSALAGEHQIRLATSAGMASAILDAVERGLTPAWIDDYPTKLAALTLDEVNAAIRRHVDPNKMVIVTAGTFDEK